VKRESAGPGSIVAVLGTGLIGASIGLALRARGRRRTEIIGWDPRRAALTAASHRNAITRRAASMEDAVHGAGTIVLAAPLDAIVAMAPRVIATSRRGALILDVGAVKRPVLAAVKAALRGRPDVGYVSGHPIAGRERPGAGSADPRLFEDRAFILVAPPQARQAKALSAAATFVRRLGAVPVRLDARDHDRVAAATSALPQLASIALAIAVDDAIGPRSKPFSGPGYRDATRLALSPFDIWGPALKANAANVRAAVRALCRAVSIVRRAVDRGDNAALDRLFSKGAKARRRVVAE
jgi:prephenate dehydrogenase